MFSYQDQPDSIFQPYTPGYGSMTQNPLDAGDTFSNVMLGTRPRTQGITTPTFVEGATYGQSKWNGSPYETDLFAPRGTPIRAPFSGTVETRQVPGPPGNGPIYVAILRGDNGIAMLNAHVEPNIRQGRIQAGDTFALVGTSGMDTLGPQSSHDHVAFSRSGQFGGPVGLTGDIPAVDFIESFGFKGKKVPRTPGPAELSQTGGGYGMPGGGPGGGSGFPGFPGQMGGGRGGSPYGGMSQPGMSGMPSFGQPPMMPPGMGMPPMLPPGFGGLGPAGLGGPPNGGGFPGGMPMLPPPPGYPGQGFMGFGALGQQQGLVPGTAGVGGGQFSGNPFGQGTAMGPVTSNPGSYPGPSPMLPFFPQLPSYGGPSGLGSIFG